MRGLQTISRVFVKRRREIVAAFMVLTLLAVASSVLMYEAEHTAQPEVFDSVWTGLYWALSLIHILPNRHHENSMASQGGNSLQDQQQH